MSQTVLLLQIPRPGAASNTFNGVGYTAVAGNAPGGPFQATHYRTIDKTIQDDEAAPGKAVIDRRQRLKFIDPYAAVEVNDTPPVPSGLVLGKLTIPVAAGSPATFLVTATAGIVAGGWVFVGTDIWQESVQVLSVGAGQFTANCTKAHRAGEMVYGAAMSRIIRIRSHAHSKQCDLEVGTL